MHQDDRLAGTGDLVVQRHPVHPDAALLHRRGAGRARHQPSTYGRNARRTSDVPTRLGSMVDSYQDGLPLRKWACRSTSAPYRPPSSASTAFTRW